METTKNMNLDYSSLTKIFIDCVLIFGPNLAFISQIKKFQSSKSSDGFSKIICLLILLANILRIFFWYGKRFDIPLLFQSIVSIIMQFILLNEFLKVYKNKYNQKKFVSNSFMKLELNNTKEDFKSLAGNENQFMEDISNSDEDDEEKNINNSNFYIEQLEISKKESNSNKNPKNHDSNWEKCEPKAALAKYNYTDVKKFFYENGIEDLLNYKMFWNWPYISDYLFSCIFFTIIFSIIFSVFGFRNNYLIETIGYISLIIESMIGIPQIIENYKNKSTKNLSFFMIFFWLTGDTLKTLYFLKFKAPIQFILCGLFQMIIDCSIIFQINYYNRID